MSLGSCVMILAAGISFNACGHASPKPTAQGEPQVIFKVHGGVEEKVIVELARTEPDRIRGLMFRQALAPGRGMLFLFEHPQNLKFWMKNTYIPLDMIFIDEHKVDGDPNKVIRKVVYVEENAEPLTLNPRGPDVDTQYVVEVPGGWARAHGVEPGVEVRFVNVD